MLGSGWHIHEDRDGDSGYSKPRTDLGIPHKKAVPFLAPPFGLQIVLNRYLWSRYSYPIPRYNLRLVAKDFAGSRIHIYSQPVHVIRAIGLVVAICFHAGKVF